jgi:hypothetical protein
MTLLTMSDKYANLPDEFFWKLVCDKIAEHRTPKRYLASFSPKKQDTFLCHMMHVVSRRPPSVEQIKILMAMLPPKYKEELINIMFAGGCLDTSPAEKLQLLPLEYIADGPYPKLWERRRKASNVVIPPDRVERLREVYLSKVPKEYNDYRKHEKEYWISRGVSADEVFVLTKGEGTDFTKEMDRTFRKIFKIPGLLPLGVVVSQRPDQSGFDLIVDGIEYEEKKGTRYDDTRASYEVIQGNKYSKTKVTPHILVIYHCNKEGFIEKAWGCVVDIGMGDFQGNTNDNNARSQMKFTWELVTRPSFYMLFGSIQVAKYHEGTGRQNKSGNMKKYPVLVPDPIITN